MLVISYGIPKSGSTLAFEIVRGVLESAGHEQALLCSSRNSAQPAGRGSTRNFFARAHRDAVARLIAEIGPDRIIAVKTHSRLNPVDFAWFEERQRAREIRVIASFRDPRDIALSLVDAGARVREQHADRRAFAHIRDLDQAAKRVERRLREFRGWAALEGTLRLDYEDTAFAPDKAISAIERALGVISDHEAVKRYAFTEASTQRNKAAPRRHETELDPERAQALRSRFGGFLKNVSESDDQAWFDKYRARMLNRAARKAGGKKDG